MTTRPSKKQYRIADAKLKHQLLAALTPGNGVPLLCVVAARRHLCVFIQHDGKLDIKFGELYRPGIRWLPGLPKRHENVHTHLIKLYTSEVRRKMENQDYTFHIRRHF